MGGKQKWSVNIERPSSHLTKFLPATSVIWFGQTADIWVLDSVLPVKEEENGKAKALKTMIWKVIL